MIGRLCIKPCVFEACCAFHWIGLRDHLVRAVVFNGGFTTPSVDEFCHPMRPVVFELPAKSRFAGLSNALEVPAFIRVFDHVFHRVFGAFHETFRVIRQFDLAARRVSDRFEVPTPIVGERRRVAVAIRYTFQSPRRTAELVYRLIFKRKGIAGSLRATERVLGPRWCCEGFSRAFEEGGSAPIGLHKRDAFYSLFRLTRWSLNELDQP